MSPTSTASGRAGEAGKVAGFGLVKRRGLAVITQGFHHYRFNHRKTFSTGRRQHINGMKNFRD
jgi:hypothetical protein